MEYFWAGIVSFVLLLIVGGIISSRVKRRRIRKATEKIFPKLTDHIQADHRYNIFLGNGKTLQNVRFIGISPAHDQNNPYLPFPLCQWLIVEKENGKRAYLKPATVQFYEDADDPK
jgi:hypothetical protein